MKLLASLAGSNSNFQTGLNEDAGHYLKLSMHSKAQKSKRKAFLLLCIHSHHASKLKEAWIEAGLQPPCTVLQET